MDLHGGRPALSRHVHVSAEHGFVYFSNPKVACSSTKASLNLAVAARSGQPLELRSMEQIHDRGHNPLASPRELGWKRFGAMLRDPQVLRFSFVRDPLKRFVSAYLSKLDEAKRGSGQSRRLFAHLGWEQGHPLSLQDFAALVRADETVRELDPHWRLQRRQIGFDVVDFGFIGDHAAFARDFELIARRIFGAPVEVFDTRTAFGRFTRPSDVEVTEQVRRDVAAAYAEDYAMLDEIRARGLGQMAA
ncbi:sulfotransferase family 2 domain-containing protein [Halovulum marinum]|uniref:sulfotransferase family 2 domain-containing protein n=1 Tax=Halovulum marinum TaxID=2662447 RepID=UPI002D788CC5|nr:sulfotransferase family 2 domain-containing protein [Halovulum marinum]